jgi:hypothetical protein
MNSTIEHNVALYKIKAVFDGQTYRLLETTTDFTLTGPLPEASTRVYINRLTGEYAITPSFLSGDAKALEWSRPEDRGCVKSAPKF